MVKALEVTSKPLTILDKHISTSCPISGCNGVGEEQVIKWNLYCFK